MESVNLESKQQTQKIDRVVLDAASIAAVQKVSDQIQNALGDLVQLSQKDVVNFLIQERSSELTINEINRIKNEHFDIVRALKRATQEAIRAKQDGHEIQMGDLLKIIQTPSVDKNDALKKPRGRKKKQNGAADISVRNQTSIAGSEQPELAISNAQKEQVSDSKLVNLRPSNQSVAT